MGSEDTCECGTDAAHAFQPFQIAERTERIAIGDDASCECWADAWEAFDFDGGGDIHVDMEVRSCRRRVMRFAGAPWQLDERGRLFGSWCGLR